MYSNQHYQEVPAYTKRGNKPLFRMSSSSKYPPAEPGVYPKEINFLLNTLLTYPCSSRHLEHTFFSYLTMRCLYLYPKTKHSVQEDHWFPRNTLNFTYPFSRTYKILPTFSCSKLLNSFSAPLNTKGRLIGIRRPKRP